MKTLLTVLIALVVTSATTLGQGFGGGGSSSSRGTIAEFSQQNSASHQSQSATPNHSELLAVSGTAVLSVKPESLRLVFAVTADEATSQACATSVKKAITEIKKGVAEIEVADNSVVEDFIVLDKKFKWELAKVEFANNDDDDEVAKLIREIPDGFRMQTNLHVLCKDEQQALDVMDVAFKAGVNDIVAFDYWHSNIDDYKKEALKKAIDEAKSKAKILLSVFDEQPAILNVASSAEISYPESQYVTIQPESPGTNASFPRAWSNYAKLPASRPRLTYYAGSKNYADLSATRPAMHPEISVSSTVTLTYGSPARDTTLEIQRLEISSRTDAKK